MSEDDTDYDYYPIVWDRLPYQIEEDGTYNARGLESPIMLEKGEWVCEAFWMYKIKGAPQWFTHSRHPAFVRLQQVLAPNLIMAEVLEDCCLPNNMCSMRKRHTTTNGARKIDDSIRDFLLKESSRRNQIDYEEEDVDDPSDDEASLNSCINNDKMEED